MRWDTKPDNRIRRTSSHPTPTRFEELLADVAWLPALIAAENGNIADARDPVTVVTTGSVILGHVLSPAGFTFQLTGTGHTSGGAFAAGKFIKAASSWSFMSVIRSGWSSTAGAAPPSLMPTTCGAWMRRAPIRATALTRWTGSGIWPWTWQARCAGSGTEIAPGMTKLGVLPLNRPVGNSHNHQPGTCLP